MQANFVGSAGCIALTEIIAPNAIEVESWNCFKLIHMNVTSAEIIRCYHSPLLTSLVPLMQ